MRHFQSHQSPRRWFDLRRFRLNNLRTSTVRRILQYLSWHRTFRFQRIRRHFLRRLYCGNLRRLIRQVRFG